MNLFCHQREMTCGFTRVDMRFHADGHAVSRGLDTERGAISGPTVLSADSDYPQIAACLDSLARRAGSKRYLVSLPRLAARLAATRADLHYRPRCCRPAQYDLRILRMLHKRRGCERKT